MRATASDGWPSGVHAKAASNLKRLSYDSVPAGTPRETVRQKIARLLEMEWIIKRPSQGYTVTAKPIQYFGPDYNVRILNDLLTTAAQIRASLQGV